MHRGKSFCSEGGHPAPGLAEHVARLTGNQVWPREMWPADKAAGGQGGLCIRKRRSHGKRSRMRITGGQAARRILKVPKGLDVRPTPDRVKQAVFNSLGARVVGARVLELFAGSGALSLECVSRGAKSALCVEISSRHASFIRQNVVASGLPRSALHVRVQDVFAAVRQLMAEGSTFHLIMADPPYGGKNVGRRSESAAQKLLDVEELARLLEPTGLLVLGHARRDELSIPDWWREIKLLRHGDNVMRFLMPAEMGAG